jgi:16S rRNA processing protein RimM
MRLSALDQSAERRELRVEALWPHKGMLVLKFAGVDSISDAELLLGSELQVPREQRAQLEPGWTYISDLVGCTVFDTDLQGHDREVGIVENVQFGAGEAPLLIVRGGARQFEIPYAQAYLKSVDLEQKRIEMLLPEGILEVNAPLTADEKRQQNDGELGKRKFAREKERIPESRG